MLREVALPALRRCALFRTVSPSHPITVSPTHRLTKRKLCRTPAKLFAPLPPPTEVAPPRGRSEAWIKTPRWPAGPDTEIHMGNIPNDRREIFNFAASRQGDWCSNATQIGISSAQANAVKTTVDAVQTSTLTAEQARNAAKTATQVVSQNYTALRRAVSEVVRSINTFAENQPTQAARDAVYNLANIQPPAPRRTNVPPNQPTNLTAGLETTTGAVLLKWKATQPSGVVYSVYRNTGTGNTFTLAGVTGEKKFADNGLTGGSTRVSYFVVATKGTDQSTPSDTLTVRFGNGGAGEEGAVGGMTFRTTKTPSGVKMAA